MIKTTTRALFNFIGVVLFIVFALIGFSMLFNRPPVDMEILQAITKGTPQDEVKSVLGMPKSTYESNRKWAYSKPFGWSIVYIYFDEQGRFEKFEYDY